MVWQGGALKDGIDRLSTENKVRLSYSDHLVQPYTLGSVNSKEQTLSATLDRLLKNTSLTYLVVGKTVILMKSKALPAKQDSIVLREKHVYPAKPSYSFFKSLPKDVKKEIWRIHQEELKHNRIQAITDSSQTRPKSKPSKKWTKAEQSPHFVKLSIGPDFLSAKFKPALADPVANELKTQLNASIVGGFEVLAGWHIGSFSVGSGLRWQHFKLEGSWTESIRLGTRRGDWPPRYESVLHPFQSSYHVYSIPVEALIRTEINTFYMAGKTSLALGWVVANNEEEVEIENFNTVRNLGQSYESKHRKGIFSFQLGVEGGWRLGRFTTGISLQYTRWLRPFVDNTYFQYRPDCFGLKAFGIYHFWANPRKR